MVMRTLNIVTEMAGQKRRNVVLSAVIRAAPRGGTAAAGLVSWFVVMARRNRSASGHAARFAIAAALLFAGAASGAVAQTLSDPAPTKWSPPSKAAKSQHAARLKACSAFGPGFVNVPGTDACVKIGGWVTVEGSARR
jgi:hypothetical protein